MTDPEPPTPIADVDTTAIVAEALVAKFGTVALRVAQFQRGLATPGSRAKWDEIVERLQGS